jgi:integrase
LFQFAVMTGFRRGEAVFLEWKNVDLERRVITVCSSAEYRVKHGKVRTFPISAELETLLTGLERFDPYVFARGDGERFSEDYVTKSFKAAVRAAGLDESLSLHSTRATFATWMADAGVPMVAVQKLLGHAYMRTTEGYTQLPAESLRKAVDSVTLFAPSAERPETEAVASGFCESEPTA